MKTNRCDNHISAAILGDFVFNISVEGVKHYFNVIRGK